MPKNTSATSEQFGKEPCYTYKKSRQMMKLILKYRNKIVSLGLLPIIATLICLHFFQNTIVLGIGFAVCVGLLLYGIIRLKDLNFFLLLGSVGIGACFALRLFTGYEFVPLGSITPILELLLLIVAFIHITAPEVYKELQERLHLRNCFSFVLEAKTIVILSALHLTILLFVDHIDHLFSEDGSFFLMYGIPVIIYILCLVINVVGIHLALQENFRYSLVRIAVVHDGKIYLKQRNDCTGNDTEGTPVWDIAVESPFEGPLDKSNEYAARIAKKICTSKHISPRLILRYTTTPSDADTRQRVSLYILPLQDKDELRKATEGRFFSFDEINETAVRRYNPALLSELDALQVAAEMWQTFGSAD
jgi:hypothetical protein